MQQERRKIQLNVWNVTRAISLQLVTQESSLSIELKLIAIFNNLQKITCIMDSHSFYLPLNIGDFAAITPSRSWYSIQRPRRHEMVSWSELLWVNRLAVRTNVSGKLVSSEFRTRVWHWGNFIGLQKHTKMRRYEVEWLTWSETIIFISSHFCILYFTAQPVTMLAIKPSLLCCASLWMTSASFWKFLKFSFQIFFHFYILTLRVIRLMDWLIDWLCTNWNLVIFNFLF